MEEGDVVCAAQELGLLRQTVLGFHAPGRGELRIYIHRTIQLDGG
jgi:hypothetical protein